VHLGWRSNKNDLYSTVFSLDVTQQYLFYVNWANAFVNNALKQAVVATTAFGRELASKMFVSLFSTSFPSQWRISIRFYIQLQTITVDYSFFVVNVDGEFLSGFQINN
jgi:hypothetical protein